MPLLKPFVDIIEEKPSEGGLPGILSLIKFVNSIGYAATLTFVFTLCAILYSVNSMHEKANTEALETLENKQIALDKKIQNLSIKKKDLEGILFVGTILLIIGVLRANAISSWFMAFMPPDTLEISKIFLTQLTTVLGGFFTLLLAVTYLPAIYILQQRAKSLLDRSADDGIFPSIGVDKTEFVFSLKEALPRIFVIITPFLTGPVADLFNKL
jgi:hypothetical protein